MGHLRLLPVSVLAGAAAATATVLLHQGWWGLALGVMTSLVVLVVTPAGWATRLPFALAYGVVVGLTAAVRGEGDYLLGATAAGYLVLASTLVLLTVAVATLPRPGRRRPAPSEEADLPH